MPARVCTHRHDHASVYARVGAIMLHVNVNTGAIIRTRACTHRRPPVYSHIAANMPARKCKHRLDRDRTYIHVYAR